MSERFQWQDHDEVTTNYGSIQLAQQQAYEAGVVMGKRIVLSLLKQERETAGVHYEDGLTYAIYKLEAELNPFPESEVEQVKQALDALIEGGSHE